MKSQATKKRKTFYLFSLLMGLLAVFFSYTYTHSRQAVMSDSSRLMIKDVTENSDIEKILKIDDLCFLPYANDNWQPTDPSKVIESINEYMEIKYGSEWVFFRKVEPEKISFNDEDQNSVSYTYQYPYPTYVFLENAYTSGTADFSFDNKETLSSTLKASEALFIGYIPFSDCMTIRVSQGVSPDSLQPEDCFTVYALDVALLDLFKSQYGCDFKAMDWSFDTASVEFDLGQERTVFFPKLMFDPAWSVKVNGKEIENRSFHGLLAVDIHAEYNKIEIQYDPSWLGGLRVLFLCPFVLLLLPSMFSLAERFQSRSKQRQKQKLSLKKYIVHQRNRNLPLSKRNINWDIVRCIAVFFVLSVHFFLYNGYYDTDLKGTAMFVATAFRNMFMSCVPLFILLTGCTMNKKQLSAQYYLGLIKTLSIFVLSVFAFYIYEAICKDSPITLFRIFKSIVNYEQYSWYVEMYIGLFLMIPFLNIIYRNLTKEQKKVLIFTFLILTAIPGVINWFDWTRIDTIVMPYLSTSYTDVFPDWWAGIYPVTYYFIGAYINEYAKEIRLSKWRIFLLWISDVVISSAYCFYRSHNGVIVGGPWSAWNGLSNVINSSLLLLLILKLDTTKLPKIMKKVFASVSRISFGVYLVSIIADEINYKTLNASIPVVTDRFPYYFAIVPFNFLCSCLLAFVLYAIYDIGYYLFSYFFVTEDITSVNNR